MTFKIVHCQRCSDLIDLNTIGAADDSGKHYCIACINELSDGVEDLDDDMTEEEIEEYIKELLTRQGMNPEHFGYSVVNLKAPKKLEPVENLSTPKPLVTPREIKRKLDQYVIGQEEAKRMLSVAAYTHLQRIDKLPVAPKANILLMGHTGSGKTLLAQTLAKVMDVPIHIADATSITSAGYVGGDVESILAGLFTAAKGDLSRAEKGIIFLDEFDKKKKSAKDGRDVAGESVQQGLLKMIEGTVVQVEISSPNGKRTVPFNTEKVLFILSGAFADLKSNAKTSGKSIGFNQSIEDKVIAKATIPSTEEIISYGIIPELVGRLPVRVMVNPLTKEELMEIITNVRDSVFSKYTAVLNASDCEFVIKPCGLEAIAEIAMKNGTGARGLTTILEEILVNVRYEVPSIPGRKKVTIGRKEILAKHVEIKILKEKKGKK